MLELPAAIVDELAAAAYDAYPYEACGLLAGCRRLASSASTGAATPPSRPGSTRSIRTTTCAPSVTPRRSGREIIGVVHSHTHSEPYPSPTDIAQAPDPAWHYVIVSLKRESPETRSYRIVDGVAVTEEPDHAWPDRTSRSGRLLTNRIGFVGRDWR